MQEDCFKVKVKKVPKEVEEREGAIAYHTVEAGALIANYCQTHQIGLAAFLREFHRYANRTGVQETVSNLVLYIKYRNAQENRQLEVNFRQYNLRFLDSPPIDYNVEIDKQLMQRDALKKQRIGEGSELGNAEVNGQQVTNGKASGGRNDYAQMPLSSIYMNGHSSPRPQAPPNCKQTKDLKQNGVTTKVKQSTKTVQDKERSFFEKVANETEKNEKMHETKAVDTSECGIDDVLVKITDLNLEYGKEINNNDEIRTETKTEPITNDVQDTSQDCEENLKKKPEDETVDIFDHEHLLHLNKRKKKTDVKEDRPIFAKKNKNLLVPTIVSTKQPSYCMKLKVKSKRSKGKKAKQVKDLATQSESFKSCELNMSFNLIDLDSTGEQASISNDFVKINDDRCSTLSR